MKFEQNRLNSVVPSLIDQNAMVTPLIHQTEEKQIKFYKQMFERKKHLDQFMTEQKE